MAAARSSHKTSAWFKFGKNGLDASSAGIYGSQGRDDFDRDDVEHVSESVMLTVRRVTFLQSFGV